MAAAVRAAGLALISTLAVINMAYALWVGCQFIKQAAYQCPAAAQSPLLAQAIQPFQGGLAQLSGHPNIGIVGGHSPVAGGSKDRSDAVLVQEPCRQT